MSIFKFNNQSHNPHLNPLHRHHDNEKNFRQFNKPSSIFRRQPVVMSFILLLIVMDAANVYSLFETIMLDNPFVLLFTTLGVSVCLEILGVLAAFVVKSKKHSNWQLLPLGFILLVLAGTMAFLRFTTGDELSGAGALVGGLETSTTANPSEFANKLLLSVLPVITTLVAFYLTINVEDEEASRLWQLQLQEARLQDEILDLRSGLAELNAREAHITTMRETTIELYQNADQRIKTFGEKLKDTVRFQLALHTNDPLSTSALSVQRNETTYESEAINHNLTLTADSINNEGGLPKNETGTTSGFVNILTANNPAGRVQQRKPD